MSSLTWLVMQRTFHVDKMLSSAWLVIWLSSNIPSCTAFSYVPCASWGIPVSSSKVEQYVFFSMKVFIYASRCLDDSIDAIRGEVYLFRVDLVHLCNRSWLSSQHQSRSDWRYVAFLFHFYEYFQGNSFDDLFFLMSELREFKRSTRLAYRSQPFTVE